MMPTPRRSAAPARASVSARTRLARAARVLLVAALTALVGACSSVPVAQMHREPGPMPVIQGRDAPAPAEGAAVQTEALPVGEDGPEPLIRRGTGQMINRAAATAPPPELPVATNGSATFNFEGESLHAVVKAILGDMLGQNYVIAPEVQGTVTLATPQPVSPASALSLLEMVLGWNNARMVYSNGRYNIVPADQALAGNVAPSIAPAAAARGFEVRTVPLQYISATEMAKLLEPYARENAIVNVDPSRNTISVAGSSAELANYLRTIEIFDVDWLSGMSVGVFPLEAGRATDVVADLEKVFGEQSESPVAGMFRFMPLEAANAVLVITPQAAYLDDIGQWLERIDGAGGEVQLFSYPLKYIEAGELAERLAQVFGGSGGGGGGTGGPSLMPGLDPVELGSGSAMAGGGRDFADVDTGDDALGSGGGMQGTLSLDPDQGGNTSVNLEVAGSEVGVSAVQETNSLLVRATPQAWRSIKQVIDKLDVMPAQVHIEAQVATVQLEGDLEYGVNWYFERAVTDAGLPNAVGRDTWSTLAGSVAGAFDNPVGIPGGLGWTFLGRNAAAVINALDQVTDVQLLQSPSVLVRNNQEATFQVGSRIPVTTVRINPVLGGGDSTVGQVQYLDTGIILKVRPRVSGDGLVFLDIVQEISSPGAEEDANGNVRIDRRRLKTEAMIRSGSTVMLAGLISDGVRRGASGFPGLSRIPVIGALFGTQSSNTTREETIILLTPTIVRNPQEARELTDEYGRRFRALEPLYQTPGE